jgi:hypothetical protein
MKVRRTLMSDAVLYFWGDSLKPDEISKAVGFAATSSKLKGQQTRLPSGKISIAKTGIWCIQTTDLGLGRNLVDHVAFLTYQVCEKARLFIEREIIQQTRISLIISGPSSEQRSSECMELPVAIINALSSCKASLMITVIWPSTNDYV